MITHCKRGHELTGTNITIQSNGYGKKFRQCRVCNRERAKQWRITNKHRLYHDKLRPECKGTPV